MESLEFLLTCDCKSNIHFSFSCDQLVNVLNCVYEPVAKFVCHLFGVWQVEYSWFIRPFSLRTFVQKRSEQFSEPKSHCTVRNNKTELQLVTTTSHNQLSIQTCGKVNQPFWATVTILHASWNISILFKKHICRFTFPSDKCQNWKLEVLTIITHLGC